MTSHEYSQPRETKVEVIINHSENSNRVENGRKEKRKKVDVDKGVFRNSHKQIWGSQTRQCVACLCLLEFVAEN